MFARVFARCGFFGNHFFVKLNLISVEGKERKKEKKSRALQDDWKWEWGGWGCSKWGLPKKGAWRTTLKA